MDTWNKLTVEVQLKEPNDFKTFFALLLRNSFDAFVWKAVTQSLNKMILITFICEVPNSWENGALRILYFVCPPCYLNKYWKQLDQFFPLCLRNWFLFCEHAFLFPHDTSRGGSTIGLPKLILMPSWTLVQMTRMLHSRMNEKISEHGNSDCS